MTLESVVRRDMRVAYPIRTDNEPPTFSKIHASQIEILNEHLYQANISIHFSATELDAPIALPGRVSPSWVSPTSMQHLQNCLKIYVRMELKLNSCGVLFIVTYVGLHQFI